ARCFLKDSLWPKGIVQRVGPKCSRIQRTGNKFPERIELGELSPGWIVKMRGSVMNVSRQPHDVPDAVDFDEFQKTSEFEFTPEGRAITVRKVLELISSLTVHTIRHDNTKWHVRCNYLPDGTRIL